MFIFTQYTCKCSVLFFTNGKPKLSHTTNSNVNFFHSHHICINELCEQTHNNRFNVYILAPSTRQFAPLYRYRYNSYSKIELPKYKSRQKFNLKTLCSCDIDKISSPLMTVLRWTIFNYIESCVVSRISKPTLYIM